jgi:hypothetical protein
MSHGWSGSTLLGNALGELPGAVHVGELRALWDEGLLDGGTCGCGLPLASCPRWSVVGERTLSGVGETAESAAALNRTVARVRNTPALLGRGPAGAAGTLGRYARLTASLYRAIRDETGARLVVDTSKRAGNAAVLRLVPGIDVRFVHLVRDPRAVAYSWRKRAAPGHGPVSVARDWTSFNVLFEAIRVRQGRGRSIRVRYEDLVRTPARSLGLLARLAGTGDADLPLVGERTLHLGPNHTVLGNPVRFRTGEVALEEDRAWERHLPAGEGRLIAALTAPLLIRYGYARPPPVLA